MSISEKFKMGGMDQKRKLDSSLPMNGGEGAKKSKLDRKTDLLKMMMEEDTRLLSY